MSTPTRFLCIAVLVATSTAAATAEPPRPLRWPEGPRPVMTYRIENRYFDQIAVEIARLESPGLSWTAEPLDGWIPVSPPPTGFSFGFRRFDGTPLNLAIGVFNAAEFWPDFSAQTWRRYLAGAEERHPAGFGIIEEHDTLAFGRGHPVLGLPNREVIYRFEGTAAAGPQARHEFWIQANGRLIVVCQSGPEASVRAAAPSLRSWLSRMGEASR
jgi:hypothetical protein